MWGALLSGFSKLMQSKAGQWLVAAMLSIGIGIATTKLVVAPGLDEIKNRVAGGAGVAVRWIGFLYFDKALTIAFSAYAAKAAIVAGKAFLTKR